MTQFGRLVVWAFGGLVVWAFGGLVVWWFSRLVVWAFRSLDNSPARMAVRRSRDVHTWRLTAKNAGAYIIL